MEITYLGHSAFEIATNGKKILIDPFLVKSPNYNPNGVSDIFVTHGHGDHIGSATGISQKTGAPVTAIFELANYFASKGVSAIDAGLGAWINYSWGRAVLVPAFHSSSADGIYTGCPCGVVFDIEGKRIYHAGDTSLNTEMKMIGEVYQPEIALLPIGGKYTMDTEHAVIASKWIGAKTIIPMHYNTFGAISANIQDFNTFMREAGKEPLVMNIGETVSF